MQLYQHEKHFAYSELEETFTTASNRGMKNASH